jgi:predicted N-acyltransferase
MLLEAMAASSRVPVSCEPRVMEHICGSLQQTPGFGIALMAQHEASEQMVMMKTANWLYGRYYGASADASVLHLAADTQPPESR